MEGECSIIGRAKTAEPTELPFGMMAGVVAKYRVGLLDGRSHWRHLENTIERLWG